MGSSSRRINAMRRSIPTLLGLVLVWGAFNTTYGGTPTDAPGSRQEEITVYTALLPEQAKAYLQLFQKAHPTIEVNLVWEPTGILTNRMLTERQNPQADILWGLGVTSLVLLEWYDLLAPYAPAGLTRVQPQFRDIRTPPYWVGMTAWRLIFCVNSEQLTQLQLPRPTAWRDLSNPIYRGHVALPNPATSGPGYVLVDAVLQSLGKSAGWEYLDALHQNVVKYFRSSDAACQLSGTEDPVAIAVTADRAGLKQRRAGTPIEVIFPSEGSGWDLAANALVKRRSLSSKPAAKTFLDWAISDSAMQAYGQDATLTAVRLDSPPQPDIPRDLGQQLFDNDVMRSAAHRGHVLREWQRRYGTKVAED
jgi:iron(III) transport system substrate-binding protein